MIPIALTPLPHCDNPTTNHHDLPLASRILTHAFCAVEIVRVTVPVESVVCVSSAEAPPGGGVPFAGDRTKSVAAQASTVSPLPTIAVGVDHWL